MPVTAPSPRPRRGHASIERTPSPTLARHRLRPRPRQHVGQDHRRIGGAVNVPLIVSEHHRSVRTPYEKPSPSCPVPGDGFLSSRHEMGGTAGIMSGSAWLASRKRWPPAISPPAKRRNRQGDRRLRERVSNRRPRRTSGARGVVDRHRLDADRDGWIRRAGGMAPLSRLPPSLRADRIARSESPFGCKSLELRALQRCPTRHRCVQPHGSRTGSRMPLGSPKWLTRSHWSHGRSKMR